MDDLIVFSVFEITQHLKQVIETQIEPLYVRGEISNYTRHSSGHLYFNLKDANATLRCTFFKFANLSLDFEPEEGMEVVCFGKLTVYEKGGSYNLNVQSMSVAGKGDLARKFELLKKKLQDEGLFDADHKQKMPRYPQRIGIVTSPTGAALQDILNILRRRFPVEVYVYPALVQGEEAPSQLRAGVQYFNAMKGIDVIILTRGGGSQEDLFCFNDEALARVVFASRVPVISAVGHEIDFTIADFVADLRAPTPSAAAELVVPDKIELGGYLVSLAKGMRLNLKRSLDSHGKELAEKRYTLSRFHPEKVLQSLQHRLDSSEMDVIRLKSRLQNTIQAAGHRRLIAGQRMQNTLQFRLLEEKHRWNGARIEMTNQCNKRLKEISNHLEMIHLRLTTYSPQHIMEHGYSIVLKDNKVLGSMDELNLGVDVRLRMKDGEAGIRIMDKGETVKPK
jgi:exodeoxyribonuclease VII large subunit